MVDSSHGSLKTLPGFVSMIQPTCTLTTAHSLVRAARSTGPTLRHGSKADVKSLDHTGYQERTTAIYVPISNATGLEQVHYTWAGTFVLEALCSVYPTLNFALIGSDCVPTTLFEVAEMVNLMTDQTSREAAMQSYTMANARDCPPAVLLMTESRAELNAGLVIVTGHVPAAPTDVDMSQRSDTPRQGTSADPAQTTSGSSHAKDDSARAAKSRRIATPAKSKSPDGWIAELSNSRASFLATSAVPEDPSEALFGGLLLTPLLGCKTRTRLEESCLPGTSTRCRMAKTRPWPVLETRFLP